MIYIIGVGEAGISGLGDKARVLLGDADIICGGKKLLSLVEDYDSKKVLIDSGLNELESAVKRNYRKKNIVVLASGDPLFHGIARYIFSLVPKESTEIIPTISYMQLAFSKIKECWDDACLVSLHAKPVEDILPVLNRSDKLCILTDPQNTPSKIAGFLLKKRIGDFRVFVFENLGDKNETITEGSIKHIARKIFSSMNMMILIREKIKNISFPGKVYGFGIPDDEFFKERDGLITKSEIRVISLSKMNLSPNSIVWDIGAGTGSVSIEAGLIADNGFVFAVEKEIKRCRLISKNINKFGLSNIEVINGKAPDALKNISYDPDSIFIGGSNNKINEIIDYSISRLRNGGRIVINTVTIENLSLTIEKLSANGIKYEVTLASIAKGNNLADMTNLKSFNPVFIISGGK